MCFLVDHTNYSYIYHKQTIVLVKFELYVYQLSYLLVNIASALVSDPLLKHLISDPGDQLGPHQHIAQDMLVISKADLGIVACKAGVFFLRLGWLVGYGWQT